MKPPKLHRHQNGHYFVHWGGKRRYLGREKDQAEAGYLESLRAWAEWRRTRKQARSTGTTSNTTLTVDQLAERFLRNRHAETGWRCREYYEKHLVRFVGMFSYALADTIRIQHVQAVKELMMRNRYAPKTITHDLTAIRVMFRWAAGMELIPPVSFAACRNPPLGPPPDRSVAVFKVMKLHAAMPPKLRPWFAVNYLAALRPSEVVKCVRGEGAWVEDGVFRLDRGKMDRRASIARHCVFSAEALSWLALAEPVFSRLDSYSQAFRRAVPASPRILRHSAARHLALAGVDDAAIELVLGHAPPRLRVTYRQPAWQALRRKASLLSLRT